MENVIPEDNLIVLSSLPLNRELVRFASFPRWPAGRPNIAQTASLAKNGFFYDGDMDRTECFSCRGVFENWSLVNDVEAEHRKRFPRCLMVLNSEPLNIPVNENLETEEEKEQKYLCLSPANPRMRSENLRLETFELRWPMGKTRAIPEEIAQAGFFFTGEGDCCKCWYCNGDLQNWKYNANPWIEHAKWFPYCQFLLSVTGQHFVYRQLALNPHLALPIIARQDGSPLESVGGQPVAPFSGQAQEEIRRICKEKVQNLMTNCDTVKKFLTMGFDDEIVSSVVEDRIIAGNEIMFTGLSDINESISQLLDDFSKKEEERGNQATVSDLNYGVEEMDQDLYEEPGGYSATVTNETEKEMDTKLLLEEAKRVIEERLCKICFMNEFDMLFFPCRHICCCMECTRCITECPICRVDIKKSLKFYRC